MTMTDLNSYKDYTDSQIELLIIQYEKDIKKLQTKVNTMKEVFSDRQFVKWAGGTLNCIYEDIEVIDEESDSDDY